MLSCNRLRVTDPLERVKLLPRKGIGIFPNSDHPSHNCPSEEGCFEAIARAHHLYPQGTFGGL